MRLTVSPAVIPAQERVLVVFVSRKKRGTLGFQGEQRTNVCWAKPLCTAASSFLCALVQCWLPLPELVNGSEGAGRCYISAALAATLESDVGY
jgi:hypothetical protein